MTVAAFVIAATALMIPWPLANSGRPLLRARVPHCCASLARDLSGNGGCLFRQVRPPPPGAEGVTPRSFVTVDFRATLQDGTRLHDSRADGVPLEFRLGSEPSEAVPGWELALPHMRVGEAVALTCEPQYAFGEAGSPPLIPANATVLFELELLSVRDLLSSNNTEELDMLVDQYAEDLMERGIAGGGDADPVSERDEDGGVDPEEEFLAIKRRKAAEARARTSAAETDREAKGGPASEVRTGPPPQSTPSTATTSSPSEGLLQRSRTWIPSRTRLEVWAPSPTPGLEPKSNPHANPDALALAIALAFALTLFL